MNARIIFRYILILLLLVVSGRGVFAQSNPPESTNYRIVEYGFGAGGVASASSELFTMFGTLGQVDQGSPSSTNYFVGAGLEYTITATTPATPTFTNPSDWYNKLKLVINPGGDEIGDYKYAITIASGSGDFKFVQSDNTIGEVLGLEDWQTYSSWGGAAGFNIIGLYPGTTYTVKVSSKQGDYFTQSFWSPQAQATTSDPSLSFDVDVAPTDQSTNPPFTLNIGTMNPGSVLTSTDKVWVSFSTNAANGGFITVNDTNFGLYSSNSSTRITSANADLSSAPSGYGARSSSATQTSGGPMRAVAPYDGSANNVGMLDPVKRIIFDSTSAPVTNGRASFELQAKASTTTPSATDYADVLTIIATGSF